MKNYEAHKAAKVRGQNAINAFFNKNVPLILARFKPFVGEKVVLASGGFANKFRQALAEIQAEIGTPAGFRWHIYSSHGYSLWIEGDKCEDVPGECGCHYQKQSYCLGNLENGMILKELYDSADRLPNFKTDFTVAGILETLKRADELERQAQNLKHSVTPFENGLHGN